MARGGSRCAAMKGDTPPPDVAELVKASRTHIKCLVLRLEHFQADVRALGENPTAAQTEALCAKHPWVVAETGSLLP